jgi:hypothetical protein
MTLPRRLHLSRHGIYYFRAIVPRPVGTLLRLNCRELRISLRTIDLRRAKTLLAEKNYIMSKHWEVQPWKIDAEQRQALYEKGLTLIKRFGAINLNNHYQLSNLSDELGSEDLKAYIFAKEYLDSLDAKAPVPPSDPPPLNWSDSKYGFFPRGGQKWRRGITSRKRSSRSCGRPTPHVRVSPRNTMAPNQPAYNTSQSVVRPATVDDIRMIERYLDR